MCAFALPQREPGGRAWRRAISILKNGLFRPVFIVELFMDLVKIFAPTILSGRCVFTSVAQSLLARRFLGPPTPEEFLLPSH